MCGIGGVLSVSQGFDVPRILQRMRRVMRHRGPDGEGDWIDLQGRVGLCHVRLAIVDLSATGRQPLHSACGNLTLVFNGEIYNWRELREFLGGRGHPFLTHTDSEVILAGYREWGCEILDRLNGMFAFALYDIEQDRLFCARDRIGKKPFVYAQSTDGFAFASEIPALLTAQSEGFSLDTRLDESALGCMLLHNLRHIPDPATVYRGLRRLRPGHAMTVRAGKIEKMWRYWDPSNDDRGVARPITAQSIRAGLEKAVALRGVADVPVGALLSGGVDSSAIVAIAQQQNKEQIRTYALGFDAQDEDLRRAREMSKRIGTQHREFYFDPTQQWQVFKNVIDCYGEPIMLLPLVHAYELCRAIHDDGVKVVLVGHGADELFYGYTGHVDTARLSSWIFRLDWLAPVLRLIPGGLGNRPLRLLSAPRGARKAALYSGYAKKTWRGILAGGRLQNLQNYAAQEMAYWGELTPSADYIDESNFVGLMLENAHSVTISADLPAMMNGIEMRAPFLDRDLVAMAWATPYREKVSGKDPTQLKRILKLAVADLVPHDLLYAPKRGFGFGIPQDQVLRESWGAIGDELFAEPDTAGGLFDGAALRLAWKHFKQHGGGGSNLIPNLFAIQLWLRNRGG